MSERVAKDFELENSLEKEKIVKLIGEIAISSTDNIKKSQLKTQECAIANFEARPYQIDAWLKLQEARQSGSDRGLINLATGLGKTTVATFDYAMFRKERLENNQTAKGLFVVHQNNILAQAGKSFQNLMPELNIKRHQSKNVSSLDADFNLATFQSLKSGIKNGTINENEFDYIVYDEAHHIEADTYKRVVEHFKPTFQLGLTATPNRMDNRDITEHFGEALYTKTLPEAIVDDYLETVDYNIMIDDAVQQMIDDNFNPETISEINELFNYEPRNEEIEKNILIEQEKIKIAEDVDDVKTIIFCSDKEHADNLAELMNGVSYHSGVKNQDSILKSFKNSDINTITAVDMFNEGVDIPDTRMIVFLRTTQSQNIFEQQLGRGLRKTFGKDRVTVLDFVANIDRIKQLKDLDEEINKIMRNQHSSHSYNADTSKNIDQNAIFVFKKEITDLLTRYYNIRDNSDNIEKLKELTNEDLVEFYNKLAPGERPTEEKLLTLNKSRLFFSCSTIARRFGSIYKFQRACGYENKLKHYTDSELVDLYNKLMPEEKPTETSLSNLSKREIFPSGPTIKKRFNGIDKFQIACGYEKSFIYYTEQEIIDLYHNLDPGGKPTQIKISQFSKNNLFLSHKAIVKRFGSISEFQIACGFKKDFIYYTNEELIELYNKISPNKKPTKTILDEMFNNDIFMNSNTVRSKFGSIKKFQIACGYTE